MAISKHWQSFLICYGTALVATLLATLLRELLDPVLERTAPFSAYYAAVMFTAWYGGLGPSLLALVSGAVLADYLFIEPRVSLLASNLEHQVGLGLYLAVGVVVALLCESLHASRRRTEAARAELAEANRGLQKEIAERQQAERWLLESEQRFRGYFQQGLVGMAMLSAQKDWLEVNHRVCQMLGYSEAELLSKTWAEVVHPDDLPGAGGAFPANAGRRRPRLCRGTALRLQGWQNSACQPFRAVHAEARGGRGLYLGLGPGRYQAATDGGFRRAGVRSSPGAAGIRRRRWTRLGPVDASDMIREVHEFRLEESELQPRL